MVYLTEVLLKHKKWLRGEAGGKRANLSNTDLRNINLSCSNLSYSDLHKINLSNSDLSGSNLSYTNLSNSDLSGSNLRFSNLSNSKLRNINLCNSDLSNSNLCGSDLSGVKGLISPSEFMVKNFEKTDEGYIAYKVFGHYYSPPESWKIEKGSIISEVVNYTRTNECGCGVNVATLDWIRKNTETRKEDIWKVLIRWEWLCDICVPYNSDGKIRCERVELLEIINN